MIFFCGVSIFTCFSMRTSAGLHLLHLLLGYISCLEQPIRLENLIGSKGYLNTQMKLFITSGVVFRLFCCNDLNLNQFSSNFEMSERESKKNAAQKFVQPLKEKRNLKEVRTMRINQMMDSLVEQTKEYDQMDSCTVAKKAKKDSAEKKGFHNPRKCLAPVKFGPNIESLQPRKKFDQKQKGVRRSLKSDGVYKGPPMVALFRQKHLAYVHAYKKLSKSEELNHLVPKRVIKTESDNEVREYWVELNEFNLKRTRGMFNGGPSGDFDLQLTVNLIEVHNSSESIRRAHVGDLNIPSGTFCLAFKNETSRFLSKPFLRFPFNLNNAKSDKPGSNVILDIVFKVVPVEIELDDDDAVIIDRQLFYLAKDGKLTMPEVNFMKIDVKRDESKEKFASLGFILDISDKRRKGYFDYCRQRKSVLKMGQFYERPEIKHCSWNDTRNKRLKADDFLTTDESEDEEELTKYIEKTCLKLQKANTDTKADKEPTSEVELVQCTQSGSRLSQERADLEIIERDFPIKQADEVEIEFNPKRNLESLVAKIKENLENLEVIRVVDYDKNNEKVKHKRKSKDPEPPSIKMDNSANSIEISAQCDNHDPSELGHFGFCLVCSRFFDQKKDTTSLSLNIFERMEMDDNSNSMTVALYENQGDNSSNHCIEKRDSNIVEDASLVNEKGDTFTTTAAEKQSTNIRKPDNILRIHKSFYHVNTFPVECRFVTGNKSTFMQRLEFPFCMFCQVAFECYELLLLHLHYSHAGLKVVHFSVNFGSVLEIRRVKKRKHLRERSCEKRKKIKSIEGIYDKNEESEKSNKMKPSIEAKVEIAELAEITDNEIDNKKDDPQITVFMFKANKNFTIDKELLFKQKQTTAGNSSEPERISTKSESMLRMNALGVMALNHVTAMSDKRSERRYQKLLAGSMTPIGFYHSSNLNRRQFTTQGYCSDRDEDEHVWLDKAEQR